MDKCAIYTENPIFIFETHTQTTKRFITYFQTEKYSKQKEFNEQRNKTKKKHSNKIPKNFSYSQKKVPLFLYHSFILYLYSTFDYFIIFAFESKMNEIIKNWIFKNCWLVLEVIFCFLHFFHLNDWLVLNCWWNIGCVRHSARVVHVQLFCFLK